MPKPLFHHSYISLESIQKLIFLRLQPLDTNFFIQKYLLQYNRNIVWKCWMRVRFLAYPSCREIGRIKFISKREENIFSKEFKAVKNFTGAKKVMEITNRGQNRIHYLFLSESVGRCPLMPLFHFISRWVFVKKVATQTEYESEKRWGWQQSGTEIEKILFSLLRLILSKYNDMSSDLLVISLKKHKIFFLQIFPFTTVYRVVSESLELLSADVRSQKVFMMRI